VRRALQAAASRGGAASRRAALIGCLTALGCASLLLGACAGSGPRRRRSPLGAQARTARRLSAARGRASPPAGVHTRALAAHGSHPRAPAAPPGPGVGALQRVRAGTSTLSVRLVRVLDPLRGSGASLLPGNRALGVVVQIRNLGPEIYDSSATADISLLASSGTPTPVFAPRGPCRTPLRDFDNYIYPGQLREGCVVFQLPARATALAVRFSPHARARGAVTWALRR
jgi:hypothetical protein